MTYGHAERALDAIRQLEAETTELLGARPDLDPEQELWLREEAGPGCRALRGAGTAASGRTTLPTRYAAVRSAGSGVAEKTS
jgi:hypothetical protein